MASCSHETTTKVLTLRNSGEVNKIDEAFILKRAMLPQVEGLVPVLVVGNGDYVPWQLDGLR